MTDQTIEQSTRKPTENQRDRFYRVAGELLTGRADLAVVLAQVGADYFDPHLPPDAARRIVNVGIREQLLIGAAAGLAMAGIRPIVHTFPPFLIERPFEQIKLDLGHQDLGAVLVSAGGSYGWPEGGETHFGPRDVTLLDTLDGWTVHVPGHPDEAEALLRASVAATDRRYLRLDAESNAEPHDVVAGTLLPLRPGRGALVVAVGPTLDRVLAATEGLDVTVAYTATPRPLDVAGLRALAGPDVVLVEPYLAGTSIRAVADALRDRPHRLLGLGARRAEQRHYGSLADHHRLHGLDVPGLRAAITGFVGLSGSEWV
jgi:transketolase